MTHPLHQAVGPVCPVGRRSGHFSSGRRNGRSYRISKSPTARPTGSIPPLTCGLPLLPDLPDELGGEGR